MPWRVFPSADTSMRWQSMVLPPPCLFSYHPLRPARPARVLEQALHTAEFPVIIPNPESVAHSSNRTMWVAIIWDSDKNTPTWDMGQTLKLLQQNKLCSMCRADARKFSVRLFPFYSPILKCWEKHILISLSEHHSITNIEHHGKPAKLTTFMPREPIWLTMVSTKAPTGMRGSSDGWSWVAIRAARSIITKYFIVSASFLQSKLMTFKERYCLFSEM